MWARRLAAAGVAAAMLWIGSEEMTIAILGQLVCSWSTPIGARHVFEV